MQSKFTKSPQRKSRKLEEPTSSKIKPMPTKGLASLNKGQTTTSRINRNSIKDPQKVKNIVVTLFKEYGSTIQFNDILLGTRI